MHLFYTPGIESSDETYALGEEESRHCVKVLRLREDAVVHLADGRGGLYTASIRQADPKSCVLQIDTVQLEYGKRPYYLHIAIAPTKNIDRFEWFLEKATEVGIDEITPVICQRSERRSLRADRLYKRITSAVKQSLKAYHPLLNEPRAFSEFIRGSFVRGSAPTTGESSFREGAVASPGAVKCIAHCGEAPRHSLRELAGPGRDMMTLVGPEGDFSPEELSAAAEAGFEALSLGESRMRTETAGLAVCFEVAFLNR